MKCTRIQQIIGNELRYNILNEEERNQIDPYTSYLEHDQVKTMAAFIQNLKIPDQLHRTGYPKYKEIGETIYTYKTTYP